MIGAMLSITVRATVGLASRGLGMDILRGWAVAGPLSEEK